MEKNMYAVEFKAIPKDGMILLPKEISQINFEMKFIAFSDSDFIIDRNIDKINFNALSLKTKNIKFDREQANER
jgi:hypothetical protein